MELERDLERFIDGLGLKWFKGRELTPYWSRRIGDARNGCPPRELWENIVKTLTVLDALREHLGRPVILTSTYRAPAYNRAVGGERASYHMKFMACDFQVNGVRPAIAHATLKRWRDEKRRFALPGGRGAWTFTGGLGLYDTFVHLDCRPYNANW